MPTLIETTLAALALLFSGDAELWQVVGVSFSVSGLALGLVLLPALLLGFALAYLPIPARWLWLSCINTLQSVPTVVIGLLLYMLLSRAGPFGDWKMLFTQQAMVVGQMLIAFPVITTMAHAAFVQSDRRAWETARTLGLSWPKALLGLMRECRFGLLAAVIGAFSRIVTEVGCSMMVGGNILHFTRNIPTAIALETQKGAFTQGVALGIVLLALALLLNLLLTACRGHSYLKN
ncbi:ABC transporter permease [Aeromonas caviae]|uniref:ABC transporter permease n=1 Tax=Aeromonas TaxID=642 RepID=UPI00168023C5|nr:MULTISPECIES: ABC transporter permease [Aeromonas]MDD9224899.1 ABC transporter permease [Aeromonas hydrophila]WEA28947.1 ABC transporter permease [Aeromonas hydrophila]BCK62286.1 ABC transporter permease [Aeromonas hydrophila]GKQ59889.1 ABC transporter permease [Aeromonas caviae]